MTATAPQFRRVLLKLSGEALMGASAFGIDAGVVRRVATEVCEIAALGVQVALVIGGGNIFRGASLVEAGMQRATADQMGMLATVMNALAMQDALEHQGAFARVMSAIRINEVCEDFIRRRAIRHLEKGRVVIFAAGTGNPYFTTDSAASLRAIEIGADLMIKATKVDGVYSADPVHDPAARLYKRLSYDQVLGERLGVMDATAAVLCRDHNVPLRVISMVDKGRLMRTILGADEGTLVTGDAGEPAELV